MDTYEQQPEETTNGHRLTIIESNGGLPSSMEMAPEPISVGEAMRRAVEELGEIVIDDQLAPGQIRQLAESYENVVRAQAAFDAKSDAAKTAKKSLESATELLLEKVRSFTHPVALPLFDQQQAETDLAAMTDAPEMMPDEPPAEDEGVNRELISHATGGKKKRKKKT